MEQLFIDIDIFYRHITQPWLTDPTQWWNIYWFLIEPVRNIIIMMFVPILLGILEVMETS